MAITYNAGTNTIQIVGYTEGTPCNFTDIYNADVAGAWGKVTRQCTNQFCFAARLDIGDGSTATWFADEVVSVRWNDLATAHNQYVFKCRPNAHIRLGRLLNDTLKTTAYGCQIHIDTGTWQVLTGSSENNTDMQFFSFSLSGDPTGYGTILNNSGNGTGKIYNCLSIDKASIAPFNIDVYNYVCNNGVVALGSALGNCDEIKILKAVKAFDLTDVASATVKNAFIKDVTYICRTGTDLTHYFINITSDNWLWDWIAVSDGYIYRQYEFDLKVIDKDNAPLNAATVKVWDKDSNLVVDTTTNASGVIATQTITRGYYNRLNGNTLQEKSPHLIKIEKAGYTTYEADFTLVDKIDWLIALQAAGGGGLLRNPPMTGGMV